MTSASTVFFLADEAATVRAGAALAQALLNADVNKPLIIFLQGNLGAGKTTLSRGLLQALGHPGAVKSPTYTLVEPYELPGFSGSKKVYHFDLYRLRDPHELEFLGAQDYFDHGFLCLIEWPERAEGQLPDADLIIDLALQDAGRCLTLQAGTPAGEQLLKNFSWPEK